VDGLEGAEADIERYLAEFATLCFEFVENFRREVQTGGGSCDGTGTPRVDCLVALPVRGFIGAIDVGWKRYVAELLQVFFDGESVSRRKADGANSQFAA